MSSAPDSVVVVGGSIAALTAAETLRLDGYDGPITLVSDEAHLPYSRVPLSKSILAGTQPLDRAMLPAPGHDISFRTNTRAVGLDLDRKRVHLAGGEQLAYDGLVIATGARARRLPGTDSTSALVLRTLDDAAALTARLADTDTVVVVGAGFLGMEIASTCRSLGKTVTVIDRDPPLLRLLGPWLATLLTTAARDHGIHIVHAPDGVTVQSTADGDIVRHDGGTLAADLIVCCVGDQPNTEWLNGSGLELAGGVVVDASCRTAPNVVAAGDVAVRQVDGVLQPRSPHWTNALEQARTAARALLNPVSSTGYQPDAYFWTEQCGLDVKISGELPLPGTPVVLEGSPADRTVLVQWHDEHGPVAAASINHRMPVVALKKLGHRARRASPPTVTNTSRP